MSGQIVDTADSGLEPHTSTTDSLTSLTPWCADKALVPSHLPYLHPLISLRTNSFRTAFLHVSVPLQSPLAYPGSPPARPG